MWPLPSLGAFSRHHEGHKDTIHIYNNFLMIEVIMRYRVLWLEKFHNK